MGKSNGARTMASIECQTMNGMFPHEVGVLIQGADRWYESMVDSELVTALDQSTGRIPVEVVERDRDVKRVLIQLPRQVIAGGRRIWVNESAVK